MGFCPVVVGWVHRGPSPSPERSPVPQALSEPITSHTAVPEKLPKFHEHPDRAEEGTEAGRL